MWVRNVTAAVIMAGLFTTGIASAPTQARTPAQILDPIFAQYKSITDARKKLRSKAKKGRPMSGDEYFAMAYACQYEEEKSPSIILTLMSRSGCKDKTLEYFVEAGKRGTPEGFLAASHWLKTGDQAYIYAQAAYQLAGGDAQLSSAALDTVADLRGGVSNVSALDAQATELASNTASTGAYASIRNAATASDVNNRLPELTWLDFKNPKRCGYGDGWIKVMRGSWTFNERTYRTEPATTTLPGSSERITGRVIRDQPIDWGDIVRVEADFKGRWNGLTVLGIFDTFIEESHGVWGDGIRFAEPVDVVADRLARAGFVVNRDGSERRQVDKVERYPYTDERGRPQVSENIDGVITRIERKDGATYFYCDEIFEASYGA